MVVTTVDENQVNLAVPIEIACCQCRRSIAVGGESLEAKQNIDDRSCVDGQVID